MVAKVTPAHKIPTILDDETNGQNMTILSDVYPSINSYLSVLWVLVCLPGTRPTDDISIEFKI